MGLHVTVEGAAESRRPALVLMHFLGGSGREWDEVVAALGKEYRTLRVDLPGFGGSAGEPGYGVAEMADAVGAAVTGAGCRRYVLVGHSMSGKVAMVMARRAQDGERRSDRSGLREGRNTGALAGVVLVAPSPPGPEPMTEEKRGGLVGVLGERHGDDLDRARGYITKSESRDIAPAVLERAAAEMLRMNRAAWVAWLERGSREDWADRVGVLGLPALVVAGGRDEGLGPEVQARVTMPHLGNGRMRVVKGCSHLVPMEKAEEMAGILREFCEELGPGSPWVPAGYLALIEGERVSEPTREVLERRMAGPVRPEGLLTAEQERTLRAMLRRVVPQESGAEIDLAEFVMARLASGKGDGWRYEVLPEDVTAYREGLDRLAARGFAEMTEAGQDEVLTKLAEKKGSVNARWFEEVRGDATAAYVAHPATLARIGYSGIGVGGALTRYRGFVSVGVNGREDWEPVAEGSEGSADASRGRGAWGTEGAPEQAGDRELVIER